MKAGFLIPQHPLIEVQNLHVRFGQDGPPAVRGVSFSLKRGESLALVGESGSGKSVTARTLVGLTGYHAQIHAAKLHFNGHNISRFNDRQWRQVRGKKIGLITQDALGSLDPLRRVGREIGETLKLHTDMTPPQREQRVVELLRAVGVPEPEVRAHLYPYQLSGGLRQRALIASAIACDPQLLIADEPTTALDATVQAQVLDLLESLRSKDTGMLIISHDLAVVARLADHVAVMKNGFIVEQGPMESVLHDPSHSYTKSLLAAGLTVRARRKASPNASARNAAAEKQASSVIGRRRPAEALAPILEARSLTKAFTGPDGRRRTAVAQVSFALLPGETLGVVGESGSGKTTLTRLVLGLEKPDSGSFAIRGRDWEALGAEEKRLERKRIQVVFQDPLGSFDPRYTVERVIGEPLDVIGYPRSAERRRRLLELLDLVRLDASSLTRRPIELSGGQRQRVAIARALAPEPEVLVCDEPVSALDVSVQAQILDLLEDLKRRLQLSCLFISHDLGVIRHVSERVLVMKDGHVVEQGDVQHVFDRPRHEYTIALLNAIPRFPAATAPLSVPTA